MLYYCVTVSCLFRVSGDNKVNALPSDLNAPGMLV